MTKDIKALVILVMFYVAVALACDPLAYKIVDAGITPIIAASLLYPMLYAFVDIIAEIYGQKTARFVVYVHIVCDMFFTFIIIAMIHLPSPAYWHHQEAYLTVFSPMGRLYIAGIIGVLASFLTNIYLLTRWKRMYAGRFFWLRGFAATAISIIIYTVVTDVIAFQNISHTLDITIANTVTNIVFAGLYIFLSVPLVRYLKFVLQKEEVGKAVNPYDAL